MNPSYRITFSLKPSTRARTPADVRAKLESLATEYGADEIMIVTITYDHTARRRSYELLADAFRR